MPPSPPKIKICPIAQNQLKFPLPMSKDSTAELSAARANAPVGKHSICRRCRCEGRARELGELTLALAEVGDGAKVSF